MAREPGYSVANLRKWVQLIILFAANKRVLSSDQGPISKPLLDPILIRAALAVSLRLQITFFVDRWAHCARNSFDREAVTGQRQEAVKLCLVFGK